MSRTIKLKVPFLKVMSTSVNGTNKLIIIITKNTLQAESSAVRLVPASSSFFSRKHFFICQMSICLTERKVCAETKKKKQEKKTMA